QRVLFEFARPQAVVLTTPNAEYNVKFEGLPAGRVRHRDHPFEWARAEFRAGAGGVGGGVGYRGRARRAGGGGGGGGAPAPRGGGGGVCAAVEASRCEGEGQSFG